MIKFIRLIFIDGSHFVSSEEQNVFYAKCKKDTNRWFTIAFQGETDYPVSLFANYEVNIFPHSPDSLSTSL